MPYSAPGPFLGAQTASAYQVSRSLRFRSSASAYLSRTPASATNQTTWTWSGWVKRGTLGGSGGSSPYFFSSSSSTTNATFLALGFNGDYLVTTGYTTEYTRTNAVFRDPCAWYHVVIAFDTTQATASNRIKCYVNGVLQTLSNTTYVAQNFATPVNLNQAHYFGGYNVGAGAVVYFDGYLAEVNFIDGQALTPSSFGQSNALTGVWEPKQYTGTYGTNGFYLPFTDNSASLTGNAFTYSEDFGNAVWLKYQGTVSTDATTAPNSTTTADKLIINNGNVNAQLYRTFTATDNTTYTISVYAKYLDFNTLRLYIQKKDASYGYSDFDISAGTVTANVSGATGAITSVGNGWYRCSTSVNVGTGATGTPTINIDISGSGNGAKSSYFWGAQIETSSAVGPYFSTAASATSNSYRIGSDVSVATGGYNSWITNNISLTSGTTYDSMIDSPTNYADGGNGRGNYAVLNPLDKDASTTLANGNLNLISSAAVGSATYRASRSTLAVSSGLWYAEFTLTQPSTSNAFSFGISPTTDTINGVNYYFGSSSGSYGFAYNGANQNKYNNGSGTQLAAGAPANGDYFQIAVDLTNGKIWFGKNNTWYEGNPSTGATPSFTFTPSGAYAIGGSVNATATATDQLDANFGQRPFAYTPPSGFSALNTQNLPAPALTPSP